MKISNKIFNYLSSISCIFMVVFLFLFVILFKNIYLDGALLLLTLSMFSNPILNFIGNKKIIKNPFFHILLSIVSFFITCICLNCFNVGFNYFLTGDVDFSNLAVLYFYDNYLYMFIPLLFVNLSSFLFDKKNVKHQANNTFILIIMLVISVLYLFMNKPFISSVSNICNLAFIIITLIKFSKIDNKDEERNIYLVLLIFSILSLNPIASVLSFIVFYSMKKEKSKK